MNPTDPDLRPGQAPLPEDGAVVTARGMIGWRHAFGDIVPSSAMHFAGGDVFSIGGAPIARDAAVVEAGLDYAFSPGAVLGVMAMVPTVMRQRRELARHKKASAVISKASEELQLGAAQPPQPDAF